MAQTLPEKWKAYMEAPTPDTLRDMLHEDCVFLSPVVFTPQHGRDMVMNYLLAAGTVFTDSKFKYTHETITEDRIVLEFEAEIDGKYLNGVDIIDYNEDNLITRFKVMVRPLQAVNMIWEKMGAQLEQAKSA